jgi:hypothetical protein
MREFGILYDREEGGEFYHLYTPVQVCACSSRWSSVSARIVRTGRRIRRSGWRRSVAKERTGSARPTRNRGSR